MLEKLLDEPYLQLKDLEKVLSNREDFKKGFSTISIPFFSRFQSVRDQPIIHYYKGSSENTATLLAFSDSTYIPIFPCDLIEVTTSKKMERYNSHTFISHILDGIADVDRYMTPENLSPFPILEIKHLKLVGENVQEIKDFKKFIEVVDWSEEGKNLKKYILFLFNDGPLKFNKAENLAEAAAKLLWTKEPKKAILADLLERFIKDQNILTLIQVIKVLSHD